MNWRFALPLSLACLFGLHAAQAYDRAKLIDLARSSVVAGVLRQAPAKFQSTERAQPVFVTIERNGEVVGCRGALMPHSPSLESEVANAAHGAATTDPRYHPISVADLKKFRVTVTVVTSQTPLDPGAINSLSRDEGLVLKSGNKTGVVLPWEGSDPHIRLQWAYKKAGVSQGTPCQLFRLQADRFAG